MPVSWNPCKPIRYVVGQDNLPEGGLPLVQAVLDEIHNISGQPFEYAGLTEKTAQSASDTGPAPVWIGWASSATSRVWSGETADVAGLSGTRMISDSSSAELTSGYAMVRVTAEQPARSDALAKAILRHEIGHLLGLNHVNDRSEVMYPTTGGSSDYGVGDRRGLWLLRTHRGCGRDAMVVAGTSPAPVPPASPERPVQVMASAAPRWPQQVPEKA